MAKRKMKNKNKKKGTAASSSSSQPEPQRAVAKPVASPSAAIHHDEVRFYVHDRFSMPVVHVLVALFTIPVFMQREPRPELAPTVKCIALCGMGWIGAIVMQKLAVGQFNPVFAAWLPVIVYLPVATVALQRVRS